MQAIYFNYHGDLSKSLEHFLECANWQKAHTVFITSVAHKLFLSGKSCVYCFLNSTAEWNLCSTVIHALFCHLLIIDGDAIRATVVIISSFMIFVNHN